ncbi:hypothetical protein Tco_0822184 [Tanacetum coccineum]|uniref:Uncharacterized protein n=1 Tax=Tanacetum coccineum TaxID=301880 RepID=A0ABQ5AEC7_9ASTR
MSLTNEDDLDGRDKVLTDVEDTYVTLTPVHPDGQQKSSSVSSRFVSNMLNPNQDTGVDDIFRQHTEATSLIDTSSNSHRGAILHSPSNTASYRSFKPQQLPIMTPLPGKPLQSPCSRKSSKLCPLFGFDHRLKAC